MAEERDKYVVEFEVDDKASEPLDKLERKARGVSDQLRDAQGRFMKAGDAVDLFGRKVDTNTKQINAWTMPVKDLAKGSLLQLRSGLIKAIQPMNLLTSGAQLASIAFKAMAGAIGLVSFVAGKALMSFARFQDEVTRAAAVSKEGISNYGAYAQAAKAAGLASRFSSTEAAKGLTDLARAGFSTTQILAAINPALQFATANSLELNATTKLVADAQGIFRANAKDLPKILDQYTVAAKSANVTVEDLAQTAGMAGATITQTFGQSSATFFALADGLASMSLRGEKAGVALRGMALRMTEASKPTTEAGRAFKQLGVSVTDAQGNFRDMFDVIGDLREAQESMAPEKFAFLMKEAYGREVFNAVQGLVDMGVPALKKLRGEIESSEGSTKKLADVMNATAMGQMAIFRGQVDTVQTELGQFFVPVLEIGVRELGRFANELLTNKSAFISTRNSVADFIGAGGQLIGMMGQAAAIVVKFGGLLGELLNPIRLIINNYELLGTMAGNTFMLMARAVDNPRAAINQFFADSNAALSKYATEQKKVVMSVGDSFGASIKIADKITSVTDKIAVLSEEASNKTRALTQEQVKLGASIDEVRKKQQRGSDNNIDTGKGPKPEDKMQAELRLRLAKAEGEILAARRAGNDELLLEAQRQKDMLVAAGEIMREKDEAVKAQLVTNAQLDLEAKHLERVNKLAEERKKKAEEAKKNSEEIQRAIEKDFLLQQRLDLLRGDATEQERALIELELERIAILEGSSHMSELEQANKLRDLEIKQKEKLAEIERKRAAEEKKAREASVEALSEGLDLSSQAARLLIKDEAKINKIEGLTEVARASGDVALGIAGDPTKFASAAKHAFAATAHFKAANEGGAGGGGSGGGGGGGGRAGGGGASTQPIDIYKVQRDNAKAIAEAIADQTNMANTRAITVNLNSPTVVGTPEGARTFMQIIEPEMRRTLEQVRR